MHVPGQRGGNITMCAAISLRGLLHHHAKLGPYNTQHILTFLDALHDAVVQDRSEQRRFVVVWDIVSFHQPWSIWSCILTPLLAISKPYWIFFPALRWRVYDHQRHARMSLLQAMEEACGDIEGTSIHGWIRHTRRYFPRCQVGENIACDFDEIL